MKYFLFLAFISLNFVISFETKSDEMVKTNKEVKEDIFGPINNLFDAMRAHDSSKILAQFTANAHLQRVTKNNEIKITEISLFAESIGKSIHSLDEKLFNISFHVQDNLASVWTPFVFYLDGKIHHCGINSFQLIKQSTHSSDKLAKDEWKIHYLIDNSFNGDCLGFEQIHKAKQRSH